MIFCPQDIIFVPFTLFDTQHFLKTPVMDSGKMSFKAVLIHWPINISESVMFPACVRCRSHIAVAPHTANIVCLRTCNWVVMPPAMATDLYVDCSLSILWLLKATNTSVPSFYITCLPSQNSLSRSTMSSVIHPFILHLNVLPFTLFSCRRFFLFRITNGVTFLS